MNSNGFSCFFFFQAKGFTRDFCMSRGLICVYKIHVCVCVCVCVRSLIHTCRCRGESECGSLGARDLL